MKKILSLCLSLLLCGCSFTKNDEVTYNAYIDEYQTYYTEVATNGKYEENSEYFTLSTEMTMMDDGTYRYYIILDEPRIAMYSVMMMAVEEGTSYEESDEMMPSFGIFEDRVSLVPNQVNRQDGYVKGISISGDTDTDAIDLLILVRWKNSSGESMSAYIRRSLSYTMEEEVSE